METRAKWLLVYLADHERALAETIDKVEKMQLKITPAAGMDSGAIRNCENRIRAGLNSLDDLKTASIEFVDG